MPQPFTCCPTGKVLDPKDGLCYDLNHVTGTDPIECPCCPVGYDYYSLTGLCVQMVNSDSRDPIPCPCCPPGYTYMNIPIAPGFPDGFCQGLNAADIVSTIPCLGCDCTEAEDFACSDCGSDGLPITFAYDPTKKNCTDCEPHDVTNPPGGIQDFLPPQFQDPIISTFRLRNKNFI